MQNVIIFDKEKECIFGLIIEDKRDIGEKIKCKEKEKLPGLMGNLILETLYLYLFLILFL